MNLPQSLIVHPFSSDTCGELDAHSPELAPAPVARQFSCDIFEPETMLIAFRYRLSTVARESASYFNLRLNLQLDEQLHRACIGRFRSACIDGS